MSDYELDLREGIIFARWQIVQLEKLMKDASNRNVVSYYDRNDMSYLASHQLRANEELAIVIARLQMRAERHRRASLGGPVES